MNRLDPEVTIPRVEYELLVLDAGAWRLLNESPHVAEILSEFIEWVARRDLREASHAISAMASWQTAVPSYAEIQRRRQVATAEPLTPQQIRNRAALGWARLERTIRKSA